MSFVVKISPQEIQLGKLDLGDQADIQGVQISKPTSFAKSGLVLNESLAQFKEAVSGTHDAIVSLALPEISLVTENLDQGSASSEKNVTLHEYRDGLRKAAIVCPVEIFDAVTKDFLQHRISISTVMSSVLSLASLVTSASQRKEGIAVATLEETELHGIIFRQGFPLKLFSHVKSSSRHDLCHDLAREISYGASAMPRGIVLIAENPLYGQAREKLTEFVGPSVMGRKAILTTFQRKGLFSSTLTEDDISPRTLPMIAAALFAHQDPLHNYQNSSHKSSRFNKLARYLSELI